MFIPDLTLDYHQFGIVDHFQIADILNKFVEDAYYANKHRLLVITGKGHVVQPQVGQLLKHHRFVASFQLAGYFNGQEGAYEVRLLS